MKKVLFAFALLASCMTVGAQNLQIHYDFGRNIYTGEESDRQKVTLTLEQFKADKLGSWYYFGGVHHKSGSFQQAGLIGAAYNGHSADFSKTWSVQLLYKQFFKSYENTHSYASAQLTGVWGLNFCNNKLNFAGFIDFWRGEKPNGHGCLVILTEPQLWYNFTNHFSVGTEMEFSNNFVYKTFFWNPTVAVKFNF